LVRRFAPDSQIQIESHLVRSSVSDETADSDFETAFEKNSDLESGERMWFAKVSEFRKDKELGYIEYKIEWEVRGGLQEGHAWRRFSAFEQVLTELGCAEDVPSKIWGTSPESRLPKLDEAIRKLVGIRKEESLPENLRVFLGVPKDEGAIIKRLKSNQLDLIALCELCEKDDSREFKKYEWKMLGGKEGIRWGCQRSSGRKLVYGFVENASIDHLSDILATQIAYIEKNIESVEDKGSLSGGRNINVKYILLKSVMWSMRPRDLVVVEQISRDDAQGIIVHSHVGLEEYEGVPERDTSNRRRATQSFGGAVLKRASDAHSFVLLANDLDPRVTGIPFGFDSKVIEMSTKMLAENLINLRHLAHAYKDRRNAPTEANVKAHIDAKVQNPHYVLTQENKKRIFTSVPIAFLILALAIIIFQRF